VKQSSKDEVVLGFKRHKSISTGAQYVTLDNVYVTLDNKIKCLSLAVWSHILSTVGDALRSRI
jgi:hypothetical protein